ncbi:MAG: HD domain-containing phosphohydrolase, partial [Sulfurimonadaceae bacterium]|nr:HD domain-containing phosphohydrolase [Sulfurimonadaceae bacterium]
MFHKESHEKELEALLAQEKETREAMLLMLEDLQEQHTKVENAHKEWMDAFDTIDDAVMLHDTEYRLMRVNRAYKDLSGAQKFKEIIGRPYWEAFPKMDGPMHSCQHSINTKNVAEEEIETEDGRVFLSKTYPIYDEDDNYSYGIHLFTDITEKRHKEQQIEELNKTLRLISRCNELLVRTSSENELIEMVCNEVVSTPEYDYAGVYYRENGSIHCHSFKDDMHMGPELEHIDFSDEAYRNCPVSVCIRDNRLIRINDVDKDPEWSGYLKEHKEICPAAKFDMQGSILVLPLKNREPLGAFVIYSRHCNLFDDDKLSLFSELADDMAFGVSNIRLRTEYDLISQERLEMTEKLKKSLDGTVAAVAKMVEARDPYTAGHQERVADLAVAIGREMGLDEDRLEGLYIGGSVHDIGKIKIPAEILTKPTTLNEIEFKLIETHPETGYDILKNIDFPWPVAEMVLNHHERIDGSGYPNGLKGDE